MLTLLVSTKPCCSVPRPLVPGVPPLGVPEAAVSVNRFWPRGSGPPGLTKADIWNWPSTCGVDCPGRVTLTWPLGLIDRLWALAGTVMPGCTAEQLGLT